MRLRARAVWLSLALVLLLGACEIPDFFGETDEGPPLPGRRIAILALDRGIQADRELADLGLHRSMIRRVAMQAAEEYVAH